MWESVYLNRHCFYKDKEFEHQHYKDRLYSMKPVMKIKGPYRLKSIEYSEIFYPKRKNNEIKIYNEHYFYKTASNSRYTLTPQPEYIEYKFPNYKSLNKMRELSKSNRKFYKKLKDIKSDYDRKKVRKEAILQENHFKNMIHNSKNIPYGPTFGFTTPNPHGFKIKRPQSYNKN